MNEDGTVKTFGFSHPDHERITVPVGEPCSWCEEPIAAYELGYSLMCMGEDFAKRIYTHRSCFLRGVIGSVAHIERRCSCYVHGAGDGDDPNLSKREAG